MYCFLPYKKTICKKKRVLKEFEKTWNIGTQSLEIAQQRYVQGVPSQMYYWNTNGTDDFADI